ncbi:ATPase, partial [Flavobacterium sp. HMWF030]
MIDNITIERFKNIKKIELKLENINILVGSNNAGKSSILQSIQFAVSIAQTTSLEEFGKTKWISNKLSTSLTTNQIIYSPVRDVYALGYGGSLSQDKGKGISVKFEKFGSNDSATFVLRKGRNKNLLTEIEGKSLGEPIRDLESPYSIYVPGLSGIPPFEELKSEGLVRRMAAKGDANNVFRNVLWLLYQDSAKWEAFTIDFKDIFPKLDIFISFNKLKDEYLNVFIKSDKNRTFPIDSFGTGVLQIIQVLSYIHLYNPKILILDEPDSHLHPSNQRILAEKLNEITLRLNFQIIISTHSRHLLDSFREYAKINWISNGEIKDEAYDFVSVLLEIGALDRGDILNGNVKCVVFTEDSKTEILETLLDVNGFNLKETQIWSYEGCSKIETAIILAAFIKEKAPQTKILIHRDSDYLDHASCQEIEQKANKAGIEIFFTIGTDIESHYLNPNHIHKIYNNLTLSQITNAINISTELVKAKSLEIFINTRNTLALGIQYSGGEKINPGKISSQCITEYEENTSRFRHGKRVLKNLKNELQQLGGQRNIISKSDHLKHIK